MTFVATIGNTTKRRPPHATWQAARVAMHLELAGLASATLADGSTIALAPRDAAVLAWLALEGPTPRARLVELLWPDSDPVAGRNSLRQRLFKLKQQCGELVSGGSTLWLAAGVAHDLAGSRTVLGSLCFPDTPDYDAWLRAQRDSRTSSARQDIERQAQALEEAGELAAALPLAQALLRLEPQSEAAHRRAMRLHYLRGDRAEALLAFDLCERMLKDEFGAQPSGETLALLQTTLQAQALAWSPGQALPASALRPPRLIGRSTELAAVASAWSAEQVFVVTGQAGTGKSRLMEAIAGTDDGTLLLRARPGDDKVPLATLDRLVHRLIQRWPVSGALPAYARFMACMAGPGADQAPSVQVVAPWVADLMLSARAHGLSAVVLDDLQFADDASADSWQELSQWPALAGLRFGFASRIEGEAATARVDGLARRSDVVMVPLQPLAAADVQPLVESLGLPLVDAPAVAAALVRRIGGNPLHLLETIRHALEKHGQLRADRLEAPARVTELLERRLVALPADGLLVVRIAAVAGNHFDPELAAVVSRRDVLELADAWHALERQGLLDARGFMHDLIGEAALRLLPQPIARVLHARVAAYLEQRGASAARLAHHLLCAGNEVAALVHLAAAARQAWHMGRSRETRDAYFKAASIELGRGQPDAAFALLYDCADAMTELGPLGAVDETIEQLTPLMRTPTQRARVALLHAVGFHLRGDHAGFRARVDATLALGLACGDLWVEAECRYGKGYYAAMDGRLNEALEQTRAAMLLYRGIGRERRARQLEVMVHNTLAVTGQVRLALEGERQAVQQFGDGSSSVALAVLTARQADHELHLGEIDAARLSAGHALLAVRATDMHASELTSTVRQIADVQRRCGDWSAALEVIDEAQQRLGAKGDPAQWLDQARSDVYLDLGRPDLAHRHLEALVSAAAAAPDSAQMRQRLLILRWRYQLSVGAGIDTAAALSAALASENLLLACDLALVAGQTASPALNVIQCAALISRCEPQGLWEQLVPLHALQARLQARDGQTRLAESSVALAREALMNGKVAAVTPLCGLWLAQALGSLGQPAPAALQARDAAAWLMARAQQSVPPEFRESFLHRNPIHRDLLARARL